MTGGLKNFKTGDVSGFVCVFVCVCVRVCVCGWVSASLHAVQML